ncbi:hypothetical protein IVB43_30690 [Bradyrhizobium sp. 48]|nr:hypothetical protein [Bradyrhizobium sp. 48]MCK1446740.1 hypothetical protein [Bradyrhizobium sp. 48]
MATIYAIESTAETPDLSTGDYPTVLSEVQHGELSRAVAVIDVLWYLEESYDVVLQNAVELEVAVARIEAGQRANVSSFPDEVDLEIRLLNRLLINFLASARAFVDSVKHRVSEAGELFAGKFAGFEALFREQFDAEFSYRLMDALRNHSQHRAAVIGQTLSIIRTWQSSKGESKQMLTVSPQIERDALVQDKKVRGKTREEIAQNCDVMIDLLPHLAVYVRCFGKIVDKARLLFQSEYDAAVSTHMSLLKDHLADDWAAV